jgi:hypothetical protein
MIADGRRRDRTRETVGRDEHRTGGVDHRHLVEGRGSQVPSFTKIKSRTFPKEQQQG